MPKTEAVLSHSRACEKEKFSPEIEVACLIGRHRRVRRDLPEVEAVFLQVGWVVRRDCLRMRPQISS